MCIAVNVVYPFEIPKIYFENEPQIWDEYNPFH